ncbi:unnamed protein product [Rotaria sp. Silwood2]|nr:unnamed protein product [Rotaria sp. Silwood2]
MVGFLINIFIVLISFHHIKANDANYKAKIYEIVGHYLRNHEFSKKRMYENSPSYYPNSNKIGLGFNPLHGSPACYTGEYQMEGLGHPVFKLEYQCPLPFVCTNKRIPKFVSLDCLPSTVTSAKTEVISTLKQLYESISSKVEVSVGLSYKELLFSYTNSKETSYMVDNIVQNDMALLSTSAQVSVVKLSMCEPLMKLSDTFRFVIENLPCCDDTDDDWETEKYVRDYILDYYGYTFVSTLLLGGIVQHNIFMKTESYKQLESRNVSVQSAATVAFYLSLGVSVENLQSNAEQEEFKKEVRLSYGTKLGGDPLILDINEWAETVPSNPIITKFGIREIFDLLTIRRFPKDLQIQNKSKLIKKILQKYIQQPLYCYNNCTNSFQGTCESSGYFQFGTCKCNENWTGIDCSVNISSTKPKIVHEDVLSGTLCGYERSYIFVKCDGHQPSNGCPQGWIPQTWIGADFTVCYIANTSKSNSSIFGGLCGLYNSGGQQSVQILCNYTLDGACPNYSQSGYFSVHGSSSVNGVSQQTTKLCVKLISNYPDLPGTLCGIQWAQTIDGPACDGYNPGLSQCPPGYAVQLWVLETGGRFHLCAKQ